MSQLGPNLLVVVGVVLVALAVGGVLALRIGQSVIPAYILLGVLLGPYAPDVAGVRLTLLETAAPIQLLADLGVILLLFFVGLELSLDTLLENRTRFLKASAVDVGVSLPLGIAVGFLLGFGWLESLFIGAIVFNSSTVIIAKSLLDLGWISNVESETILGVVVIEDIVTAVYFAVLSMLLLGGGDPLALPGSLARAFAFLLALGLLAYYGSAAVERVFDVRSAELFLVGVLGITVLVSGLGLVAGVSDAVAAFFVGTMFGRTDFSTRIGQLVAPSRDLFAALFFFAIGLRTDPRLLLAVGSLVLVATLVTIPGQLLSGFYAGRAYGLTRRRAVRVGSALAPRGEFSLVIAAFLVTAGTSQVYTETIPAFTVGYVLVTSVLGTILMRQSDRFGNLLGE